MQYSQKMLYVCEQLRMLEDAICKKSHDLYVEAFSGRKSVSIISPEATKAFIYQHFKYYEGPLVARYLIVIQIYSIFERYSVKFSIALSEKEDLLKIDDLRGGRNFTGIKTFYTKVLNIEYQHWGELDKLRQVRNLIAHCDGYVEYSEQKTKIAKTANNDTDLLILGDGRLALNEEFIKRGLRAVFGFFDIVEPMVEKPDRKLDFSWGHILQFQEFDRGKKFTEQNAAADPGD